MSATNLAFERMSDEALVAELARAQPAALAELYNRHRAAAYGLAVRILHDRELAEDAVHDAFIAAWRSASRFAPERSQPRSWLLMLVHRRAVDIIRRRALVDL